MEKHEAISAVLQAYGIDPDSSVKTDNGTRTAFDILEAYVMLAMDEIEGI